MADAYPRGTRAVPRLPANVRLWLLELSGWKPLVSVHACGGIFGSLRSAGLRCGRGGHRARSA